MGALAAFGDLPARCALASTAGCDLLFVCSRIETYPDCFEAVERTVSAARRREASARLDAYADRVARIRANALSKERSLPELISDIRELRDRAEG